MSIFEGWDCCNCCTTTPPIDSRQSWIEHEQYCSDHPNKKITHYCMLKKCLKALCITCKDIHAQTHVRQSLGNLEPIAIQQIKICYMARAYDQATLEVAVPPKETMTKSKSTSWIQVNPTPRLPEEEFRLFLYKKVYGDEPLRELKYAIETRDYVQATRKLAKAIKIEGSHYVHGDTGYLFPNFMSRNESLWMTNNN